ncbi:50S ribosomal protein L16 (mitochondrion) [Nannochloropsis gaditana]|uniref:50S ribosomal protein L16 n=1 Tax=Nannochloropsis gaditana TaxID=72520 RepID=K9ZXW2_9STRA|nr:50S ribosomal protein L16 [Nannochloropsis gaditana]AFZ64356.1 50S ribosomal protein L16 [Nannochloropsis gaditana]AGI49066.1 50S ribosomal protein L16 [Nannochloropsis gaditana]AHX24923.1 50S ribosomal protein L16 [Nannochloropsis gaditana]
MLLKPNRTKYTKSQRGRLSGPVSSFVPINNGRFALIAQESRFLSAHQIESTRQVINRYLKRKGKIWIKAFPDLPVTSKPTEVRMGKGKGVVKEWVCRVRKGKVLFEVDGVSDQRILDAFQAAKKKLPFKTLIFKNSWKLPLKI